MEIVFNYYLPSVGFVIYGCRRDFVAATTHESPVPDLHTHNPPPPTPSTHPAISYPRWLRGSFLLLRCFACFLCAGYYGFESTAFIYDIGCFCIYFRAVGSLRFALLLECFMAGFPLYWPAARRSREYCSSYGSSE